MKEKILNLGKLIVEDLKLEPRADTLSRWMAHYIAEKIVIVENTQGAKKQDAEKKCFDAILKLWKHRSYYKDGQRPFENYETIFRTLEKLDSRNKAPYFYSESKKQKETSGSKRKVSEDVQKLLDMVSIIDQTARIWIEFVLNQAVSTATDEKVKKYLQNTYKIEKELDTRIIVRIIGDQLEKKEKNTIEKLCKERRKELRTRIKQLEAFEKFNMDLCKLFNKELQSL